MIIQLTLTGKKACVIGGGKMAYEKACMLLAEQMEVTCIAKTFLDAFQTEKITCVMKAYEASDLKGCMLVYACSDDKRLNQQVVEDGNRLGILTASVTYEQEATFHPLTNRKWGDVEVACTTNGAYPMLADRLLANWKQNYQNTMKKRLPLLKKIRRYVIDTIDDPLIKHDFLEWMLDAEIEELTFYDSAITSKQALLFAFHGSSLEDEKKIYRWLKKLSLPVPVWYGYLNQAVIEQCHDAGKHIWNYEKLRNFLESLQIKVFDIGMLLEHGRYYQQFVNVTRQKPLFDDTLLTDILHQFEEPTVFVVHPSKDHAFYDWVNAHKPYGTMVWDGSIPVSFPSAFDVVYFGILNGVHHKQIEERLTNMRVLHWYDVWEIDSVINAIRKKEWKNE